MADNEVSALKEALCNQYIIMKKLSAELEEEREASATAASEALSMILRLQREKAAEKMESSQYKRMAEEKMHHAEERMEFLEEIIQQNEMEITSLKYQVETYKQKLARHGVNIPDVGQMSVEEQVDGSKVHTDKKSFPGFIRRNVSLPSLLQLDQFSSHRDVTCDESKAAESDSSLWKQAEELNKKLKDLMQPKNSRDDSCSDVPTAELFRPLSLSSVISDPEFGSCLWYSAVSAGASFDSTTAGIRKKTDGQDIPCLSFQVRGSDSVTNFDGPTSSSLEVESNGNPDYSARMRDKFEISESHKAYNPDHLHKQVSEESVHEADLLGVPNQIPQESGDYHFGGDGWLNKGFTGQFVSKSSSSKKPPKLPRGSKLSTPSKGTSLGNHSTLGDSMVEIGTSQVDLERLKLCSKQLQKERPVMHEDAERNKEHLMLLRDIFKQLNKIEEHMKKPTSKKYDLHNDSKVVTIIEAFLSFSI